MSGEPSGTRTLDSLLKSCNQDPPSETHQDLTAQHPDDQD